MQAWPGDVGPMATPQLVERVKSAQRQSSVWKEAWHRYCDAVPSPGQTVATRDPAKHQLDFVTRFVAMMEVVAPLVVGQPVIGGLPRSIVSTTRLAGKGGNLGPRVVQAGTAPAQLVERVKEVQKLSQEHRQLWHQYCDIEGGGVRDPSRHNAEYLEQFFSQVPLEFQSQPLAVATEEIVQQVKNLQRSHAEYKDAWHTYCDTEGNFVRDPAAHSDAFLTEFLSRCGAEVAQVFSPTVNGGTAMQPIGALSGGDTDAWSSSPLVEQVKHYQKTSAEHMERWRMFCDTEGEGVRDPAKHDGAFLERFLGECGAIQVDVASADPAPQELVDQVKRLQKTSQQLKLEWHRYCDTEGDRVRDPARHSAAFLEAFLSFAAPFAAFGGVKRQIESVEDGSGLPGVGGTSFNTVDLCEGL
eukprot:CAMPEP_0194532238 /NCGR_PEP_ID=MMETSP0253-20130528/69761_1 /TAXON_ID=2966 /ORGANISM="Noctiluca scintillans" /LENGTH=412 /DNA_ID=CAMNT_0039377669 /DNA_START=1 /DNA_END=1236 /DNA_ORIENTATION=-